MKASAEVDERKQWGPYFEHLSFLFENIQPESAQSANQRPQEKVDLLYPGERYELLFQGTVDKSRHVQTRATEKVYPVLGRVHADIEAQSPGKPELKLALTHSMPWFARYRIRINGRESTSTSASFVWPLVPGKNEVVISAINTRTVEGKPTSIVVEFIPPS
jgi:hypothetical protein